MGIPLPIELELVRVIEQRWIAIGCGEQQQDTVALRNRTPVELDVRADTSTQPRHWGIEPQNLFHKPSKESRVIAQCLPMVRVRGQMPQRGPNREGGVVQSRE